ncbi:MAG: glycosyltransferase family 1 protein, partial [Paracoccus sp. (in: a-proteobacteria)]
MAPHLMPHFLMDRPDTGARPIDLHSRIATGGTPWYQAMRSHAAAVARDMPGIKTTPQERISQPRFLKE